MTREDARKTIDDILACFGNKPGDGTYELTQLDAKDMREAIKRLSVVECEDAISRADAISLFKDDVAAVNELMQLESVHPKVCECEDCISRKDVIDAINQNCIRENEYNLTSSRIKKAVESLPPVTPKQKMGRWIHFAWSDDCSECGWSTGKYGSPTRFCPNCGVQMESEDRE